MKFTTLIFIRFVIVVMSFPSPIRATKTEGFGEIAQLCDPMELMPCREAVFTGGPPSRKCCKKLEEQKPCLCGYIRDPPIIITYVSIQKALKVFDPCKVHIPTCWSSIYFEKKLLIKKNMKFKSYIPMSKWWWWLLEIFLFIVEVFFLSAIFHFINETSPLNLWIYGIAYTDIYSLVVVFKFIRILLSIAAYYDDEIWKMDVKINVFNRNLEENMYMTQPEGWTYPGTVRTKIVYLWVKVSILKLESSFQWGNWIY